MKLPELIELAKTPEGLEQIRVMVAELDGFIEQPPFKSAGGIQRYTWKKKGVRTEDGWDRFHSFDLPPYTTSLDAVMPLVRGIKATGGQNAFVNIMSDIVDPMGERGWQGDFDMITAEPHQICIALILTLQQP